MHHQPFFLAIALTVAAVVAIAGCSSDEEGHGDAGTAGEDAPPTDDVGEEPVPPLVSPSLWTPIEEAADDPLAEHRPEEVECPGDATKTEMLDGDLSYAVDTTMCNYLAVSQASLGEVSTGDTVQARIWHFDLTPGVGEESATAHVAILFDGDIAWETDIEIPADGQLLTPEWEADDDYPPGTEIVFHLHNHGDNQWNFIDLSVL